MDQSFVIALGLLTLRLAFILAGVLFCWFGYRLFARTRDPSGAELSFKNLVKVNLHQVAPGIFFSLFGAAIIVYSIERLPPVTFNPQDGMVLGMQSGASDLADRAAVLRASDAIAFINRIDAKGCVADQDRKDIERMSERIRLTLMRSVWQSEWGDPAEFEASLRDPSRAPNPKAKAFFERR